MGERWKSFKQGLASRGKKLRGAVRLMLMVMWDMQRCFPQSGTMSSSSMADLEHAMVKCPWPVYANSL